MCECCTPKEHLGHLHLHGFGPNSMESLEAEVRKLPGVFRAIPDDHGDAEAVVLFDKRIISEDRLKSILAEQGYQV